MPSDTTGKHRKHQFWARTKSLLLFCAGGIFWGWVASFCWWWPGLSVWSNIILSIAWLAGGLLWWIKRRWRWSTDLAGLAAITVLVGFSWQQPRHDRHWVPEQAHLATTDFDNERIYINNVRRQVGWNHDQQQSITWQARSYDLATCATVDLLVVPFGLRRGPAHVMVSFGFDDERYLAISVEARREVGEAYDIFNGMRRHYEIIYIVGDERDVLGRRLYQDGNDIYCYRLRATPQQARHLLSAMLTRANEIAVRPEFYHTTLNSCASNLRDHGDQVLGHTIGHDWRVWLPGYGADLARDHNLIDQEQQALILHAGTNYGLLDDGWSQRIRTPN